MSAYNKKPFCKVCFDAKKPESEYTSHHVRSLPDMNGKTVVTCPVLKATECRYCYNLGHTAKFCPVLEENKKKAAKAKSAAIKAQKSAEKVAEKSAEAHRELQSVKSLIYKGKFAGLNNDSDEEIEQPVANASDFPNINTNSYAMFCAAEKAAEGLWRENRSILHNISTITHPVNSWAAIAAKPAAPSFKPAPKVAEQPSKSWVDESDSEEEEVEAFPAMPVRTTSMFTAASYMKEEEDEFADAPVITRTTSVRIPENGRRFVDDDEEW